MTRVIKIGGRVQRDPELARGLARAVSAARGRIVVVHGGGDDVSGMQRRLGLQPRFVAGRRVTTPAELDIVRMVLSGTANKRLVACCRTAGLRAVGISGEDGGLLVARVGEGEPLGRVGENVSANPALLEDLLAAGWVPIVSPLAADADDPAGTGLNVNGDDAAAAIAVALGAAELLLVADVEGVIVNGSIVPTLAMPEAAALVDQGVARAGMAAKLQAGFTALSHGVTRVRIGDLAALTDDARGTALLSANVMEPWPR